MTPPKPKILLVSAKARQGSLLRKLASLGAEMLTASNAKLALTMVNAEKLALVVIDSGKSHTDVHALAQQLRAGPEALSLAFITSGDRSEARRIGKLSLPADTIVVSADDPMLLHKLQLTLDLYTSRQTVNLLRQTLDERSAQFEAEVIQRRRAEEIVHYQASHDALTGLPNRVLCLDRLETALQRSALEGRMFAFAYLDLDDFKHVNDRHGHQAGDELLRQVAVRLRTACRKSDTVARLGGDEFGVVIEELGSAVEMPPLLERLRHEVARNYSLNFAGYRGTIEMAVTVSVGASIFPTQARTVDDLIRAADMAMYQAKASGKNRYVLWADPAKES